MYVHTEFAVFSKKLFSILFHSVYVIKYMDGVFFFVHLMDQLDFVDEIDYFPSILFISIRNRNAKYLLFNHIIYKGASA